MSDAKLRHLERNAASGTTRDQAALLRERIRVGELTREQVELAAYCGDAGARVLVRPMDTRTAYVQRWESWEAQDLHQGLGSWTKGLARWGKEVTDRSACAAARVAYSEWLLARGWPLDFGDPPQLWRESGYSLWFATAWETEGEEVEAPGNAIRAAESWIIFPCEEHLVTWREAFVVSGAAPDWLPWDRSRENPIPSISVRVMEILAAARQASEQAVRKAIQAELIPWTLARGDPVAERVAAAEGRRA